MKITYGDAQLGEIIEYHAFDYARGIHIPHQGTVIALLVGGDHLILGWDHQPNIIMSTLIKHVSENGCKMYVKIPEWGKYTHYNVFNYKHTEVIQIIKSMKVSIQEKPCLGCGAINDVGVKVCYRCGGLDPTNSGVLPPEVIRRGYI